MIGSKFPICQAFERSFSILPDMAGSSSSSPSRADAENARIRRILSSNLYFDVSSAKAPVVYSSSYDIAFMGIEKLHPFDSSKWGRICQFLISEGILDKDRIVEPLEASREDLLVHELGLLTGPFRNISRQPQEQFNSRHYHRGPSRCITPQLSSTAEGPTPLPETGGRYHLGGKVGQRTGLGNQCWRWIPSLFREQRVMIIDLDAHQGNGHEIDFSSDGRVYILDMYNAGIYPFDYEARRYIHQRVELSSGTKTEEYLELLERALAVARNKFDPELVVYNAGTDILDGDSLGQLKVSPDGVKLRDEMVFRFARDKNSPVVMLTSGGYMKSSARVVANSIINLTAKGLVKMSGVPLCDPSL
ncbi:histone deacetylase 2 isoform X3 [Wolffia australiana]